MENTTVQILNINEVHEVASYPYGRLRCKAFFSVEFKKGKGFRSVFQTINPKTNRLNAPKKETYTSFAYQTKNEDGKINTRGIRINGNEGVNKFTSFLYKNQAALNLNDEMIKDTISTCISSIRISLAWASGDKKQLMKVLDKPLTTLESVFKTADVSLLKDFHIDIDAIKEIENNSSEDNKIKFVSKTYEIFAAPAVQQIEIKEDVTEIETSVITPAVQQIEIKENNIISFPVPKIDEIKVTGISFINTLITEIKANLKKAKDQDQNLREILFLIACEKFPTFWNSFKKSQQYSENNKRWYLLNEDDITIFKIRNNFIDIQKYCAFLDQMDILEIESLFDYIGEGGRVENIIQYQNKLEIEKTATTPTTFFNSQLDIFGNETKINKAVKQLSMF